VRSLCINEEIITRFESGQMSTYSTYYPQLHILSQLVLERTACRQKLHAKCSPSQTMSRCCTPNKQVQFYHPS